MLRDNFAGCPNRVFVILGLWLTTALTTIAVAAEPINVKPRATWQLGAGATDKLAIVPTEPLLAVGHRDGSIAWWTMSGKSGGVAWPKRNKAVTALTISSDGQLVAVAWEGPQVEVWDRKSRKMQSKFVPATSVSHLEFTSDNNLLAVAEQSRGRIINTKTGAVHADFRLEKPSLAIGFQKQDQLLYVADGSIAVTLYEPRKRAARRTMFYLTGTREMPAQFSIQHCSISDDRRVFAACIQGGRLVAASDPTYGARRGQNVTELPGWDIFRVGLSRDGHYAVCVAQTAPANGERGLVWDLVEDRLAAEVENIPAELQGLAFASGSGLLAVSDAAGKIAVWDLSSVLVSTSAPTKLHRGRTELPVSDGPPPPIEQPDWNAEQFTLANAPGYLRKDVWRLTPKTENASKNWSFTRFRLELSCGHERTEALSQ